MSPSRRRAIGAVRGFASRASPYSPPAPRCRTPPSCALAVGRNVLIAPPRHWRGARFGIPYPSPRSTPSPRHCLRWLTAAVRSLACPVVRSRCGRARCPHRAAAPSARCAASHLAPLRVPLPCAPPPAGFAVGRDAWPPPPVGAPHPPGSRRRAIARGGSPPRCAAGQVAHAESFACRGSVCGTVRGRAAHPARCHDRAAIYPRYITHGHGARALPGQRDAWLPGLLAVRPPAPPGAPHRGTRLRSVHKMNSIKGGIACRRIQCNRIRAGQLCNCTPGTARKFCRFQLQIASAFQLQNRLNAPVGQMRVKCHLYNGFHGSTIVRKSKFRNSQGKRTFLRRKLFDSQIRCHCKPDRLIGITRQIFCRIGMIGNPNRPIWNFRPQIHLHRWRIRPIGKGISARKRRQIALIGSNVEGRICNADRQAAGRLR